MGTMASQITSVTIVYSTVYSGADQRKHKKLRVTSLCARNSPVTGEFPAQMASNAENVSILWRHNGYESIHHMDQTWVVIIKNKHRTAVIFHSMVEVNSVLINCLAEYSPIMQFICDNDVNAGNLHMVLILLYINDSEFNVVIHIPLSRKQWNRFEMNWYELELNMHNRSLNYNVKRTVKIKKAIVVGQQSKLKWSKRWQYDVCYESGPLFTKR